MGKAEIYKFSTSLQLDICQVNAVIFHILQATDTNRKGTFRKYNGPSQIFKLIVSTSEKIPNNINVVVRRQLKEK